MCEEQRRERTFHVNNTGTRMLDRPPFLCHQAANVLNPASETKPFTTPSQMTALQFKLSTAGRTDIYICNHPPPNPVLILE